MVHIVVSSDFKGVHSFGPSTNMEALFQHGAVLAVMKSNKLVSLNSYTLIVSSLYTDYISLSLLKKMTNYHRLTIHVVFSMPIGGHCMLILRDLLLHTESNLLRLASKYSVFSRFRTLTLKPYLGSLKTPEDQNASYFFNRLDVFAVNLKFGSQYGLWGL